MNAEFDHYFREKYPLIFSRQCELSVGDGWFDILDRLCANIQSHIDVVADNRERSIQWNKEVNDPEYDWSNRSFLKRQERNIPELIEQVVATQVKEKFGTLRFYYQGGDDYIRGLDAMAESMSAVICEECGSPGERRSTEKRRWMRVLCDNHAHEFGYIEDQED